MGWRLSFGVGPFRYSAPIGRSARYWTHPGCEIHHSRQDLADRCAARMTAASRATSAEIYRATFADMNAILDGTQAALEQDIADNTPPATGAAYIPAIGQTAPLPQYDDLTSVQVDAIIKMLLMQLRKVRRPDLPLLCPWCATEHPWQNPCALQAEAEEIAGDDNRWRDDSTPDAGPVQVTRKRGRADRRSGMPPV